MHFRKQMVPEETLSVSDSNGTLYSVGTFAYRSLGLRESLARVLSDIRTGRFDSEALVGAFCFLLCNGEGVTFLTDRMNLLHVFTNREQSVFSSSFAAVLKAGPRRFKANVPAILENALTGYVIGPETIAHDVFLLDSRHRRQIKRSGIRFLEQPGDSLAKAPPKKAQGFEESIDDQLNVLHNYFHQFQALADTTGAVDIGLSGGYDSRLLVLLAKQHYGKVIAHSHYHRTPTVDELIAKQVAAALRIPHYRCEEAKQPPEMSVEEFERNVGNAAAYTDGRVFHDYDWLGYFRTRWYREKLFDKSRFGMNGLGGELYRNAYHQVYQRADVREWIKAKVMGAGVSSVTSAGTLNDLLDRLISKAGNSLGTTLDKTLNHSQMRRYFGELFSVYCAAPRMCIDNQLAFSLSPYLDYPLRGASYRVLPHLGIAGKFEGRLINLLDPKVAAITSSYGHGLDGHEPSRFLIRCAAKGLIPHRIQNFLHESRLALKGRPSRTYKALLERQPLVRRAVELMRTPRFDLVWDHVIRDEILVRRVISLGIMLIKFADCIEVE